MNSLPDPRYTTHYLIDYQGTPFHEQRTMRMPLVTREKWCRPGYYPQRPNKGWVYSINDYPFHTLQHHGGLWGEVVNTPYPDEK